MTLMLKLLFGYWVYTEALPKEDPGEIWRARGSVVWYAQVKRESLVMLTAA
jgi:hypothetical protein